MADEVDMGIAASGKCLCLAGGGPIVGGEGGGGGGGGGRGKTVFRDVCKHSGRRNVCQGLFLLMISLCEQIHVYSILKSQLIQKSPFLLKLISWVLIQYLDSCNSGMVYTIVNRASHRKRKVIYTCTLSGASEPQRPVRPWPYHFFIKK